PRPPTGGPGSAGRPPAGPHGHRARLHQAARHRPQPAPADQRAHRSAAPWRAAWPARPRAGRRLAPAERGTPMASSRPWPFDDEDRPSGSVPPLSQADLQAILAHLADDPDELLAGTGVDRPVVALRVRASVGQPGGSAQARWGQLRAAELAAWTRT